MSEPEEILLSREGGVAILTINRPQAMNSFNQVNYQGPVTDQATAPGLFVATAPPRLVQLPLIMDPVVFIHPGGLQGLAIILICGLIRLAIASSGRTSARSWSIEKAARLESAAPAGWSIRGTSFCTVVSRGSVYS